KHSTPETVRQLTFDHGLHVTGKSTVFQVTDVRIKGSFRASCISSMEYRHCVPAPHQPLQVVCTNTLLSPSQVQDVSEIDRIPASDQITRHEACRAQDHGNSFEMRLIDEGVDTASEIPERLLSDRFLKLFRFEVPTGK